MKPGKFIILAVAVALSSCGSGTADQGGSTNTATSAGGFDRKTFVLCPALEDHRDELSSIVGFVQDSTRGIARSENSRQCFIRGHDGGTVGVEILPPMPMSIAVYAQESFDSPTNPVSGFPVEATYVDSSSQPHVVFSMDPLVIDVYAEYGQTLNRESMLALATRVREILLEAN